MRLHWRVTCHRVEPEPMPINLKDDIEAILARDASARTFWEVLTCYPGIHAVTLHRLTHQLWNWRLRWLARFIAYVGRWLTGIDIHPGAIIGRRLFINGGVGVVIGETSEIGNDVTLYSGVTLSEAIGVRGQRHPMLRDGVTVESGAKIIGPIIVGERTHIQANSVLTESVEADSKVTRFCGYLL